MAITSKEIVDNETHAILVDVRKESVDMLGINRPLWTTLLKLRLLRGIEAYTI
jgi:hypothetical protein